MWSQPDYKAMTIEHQQSNSAEMRGYCSSFRLGGMCICIKSHTETFKTIQDSSRIITEHSGL